MGDIGRRQNRMGVDPHQHVATALSRCSVEPVAGATSGVRNDRYPRVLGQLRGNLGRRISTRGDRNDYFARDIRPLVKHGSHSIGKRRCIVARRNHYRDLNHASTVRAQSADDQTTTL